MPTTATQPETKIQMPDPAWFSASNRFEVDLMQDDPAYTSFHHVSRFVGAWASAFPAERPGRWMLDVPRRVYVPLVNDLAGSVEGESRCLTNDSRTIDFEFKATFIGVEEGFAVYQVEGPDEEKTFTAI